MKLSLAKVKLLTGCVEQFIFKERINNLRIRDENLLFTAPVNVKGEIENLGNGIFQVTGFINSVVEDRCYRCLCATEVKLNIGFSIKFSDVSVSAEEEDIFELYCDDIDLKPYVINEIVLNWPGQVLCTPECKGLCQHCGANLNTSSCRCENDHIDPRLSILKQFMNED